MDILNIKKSIYEILEECGIIMIDNEDDEIIEMDSMQFVSVIIQLEDLFEIMIDDQYLLQDEITVQGLANIVNEYLAIRHE